MGVLIGKRGQTLDSLQYLISLVVNRDTDEYIHVKVDTENYRTRRKATLENLAKNIAYIGQISVLDLAKGFHKFLSNYFEYILVDGDISDKNIFEEEYLIDERYVFNRLFLDERLISYKNYSPDEFNKNQNLFNSLCLE